MKNVTFLYVYSSLCVPFGDFTELQKEHSTTFHLVQLYVEEGLKILVSQAQRTTKNKSKNTLICA